MIEITQHKAKHIGWNVVAYGNKRQIEIMQSSTSDEGAAFPAQSITINHEGSIRLLRDFCNEILEEKAITP